MKLTNIHEQPIAYILVGLPGSGKSTWTNEINRDGKFALISSDDHLERIARDSGKSYSDVFNDHIKAAGALMNADFRKAVADNRSIIWDQTNMTSKKRKGILQQIPNNYKKIAVVFQIDPVELERRLEKRGKETGKIIPNHILSSMAKSFEMPTRAEGFNEILVV